ncbi:MAG: hypothetical protein JWP18_425 [Solirubrobacterales bacterium]|nr:hypothetical protein [Solirubrobacterales bacterium]
MSDDKTPEPPAADTEVASVRIEEPSQASPVGGGVPVPEPLAAPVHDLTPEPQVIPVVADPEPDALAVHTPVTVRDPEPGPEPLAAQIAPEPTPTVSAAEASWSRPAGSAAPPPVSAPPSGDALADRPEVLVGAAFAGGLVVAMILKRLGR